jgi:hypothetical protein
MQLELDLEYNILFSRPSSSTNSMDSLLNLWTHVGPIVIEYATIIFIPIVFAKIIENQVLL